MQFLSHVERFRVAWILPLLLLAAGCGSASTEVEGGAAAAASKPVESRRAVTFESSFAAGRARAKQEGKPLLLLFKVEGCTYCGELKNSILTEPQVVELSRQFVCAEVDLDREGDICKQYRVRGYPTVLFTDPEGKDLVRLTGVKPVTVVTAEMESALRTMALYTAAARRNGAQR